MLFKLSKLFKFKRLRKFLFYIFISGGLSTAIIIFVLQKVWKESELPVPKIVVSSYAGTAPHTVTFDATPSSDPNGKALSYYWSIDDKFISEQPYFKFVFDEVGESHITLTVTNSKGMVATTSAFITTNLPVRVYTVADATKYYRYEAAWVNPREILKYYPMQQIKVNNKFVNMFYQGGEIYAVISELNRVLFGIWQDEDGEGTFELIFDQDFIKAEGWWKYDNEPQKFKFLMRRTGS